MSRCLTRIAEDLEEECTTSMQNDSIDLSKIMVHVQQVEESKRRKHNRVGNKSRQAEENFQERVVPKSGISPGLRRYSPTKGSQVHPRVVMIEILSPEFRETMK